MPNNISTEITANLAQWISHHGYQDLPQAVREKAVDVLYDTVGSMVACSTLPEARAITQFLVDIGGSHGCTIIGQHDTTSVVNAAMAHGAMAHGDESDAVHLASSGGHVAASPVAAALALGERLGSSGKELVRAIALGYEIGGRLMTIFYRERDYVARRFYPTSVIGCLSSAIAAGVLLNFDARKIQVALGLAAYQAAGPDNFKKDAGHMGKTFQVATSCRNGVTAALLADQGAAVPLDILDGSLSLFDVYLGKADAGNELLQNLGTYYAITDVMHKRFPVGTPSQASAQGLLSLLHKHPLAPEDIAQITVQMNKATLHSNSTNRPASIDASAVLAVAAIHRKLDFYQLHNPLDAITPEVEAMQKKIRLVPRDDWLGRESDTHTVNQHNRHAIVTITTTSGLVLEEEAWFRPMTRVELDQKFDDLVKPRLGVENAVRAKSLLQGIETASSIRPLMALLRA